MSDLTMLLNRPSVWEIADELGPTSFRMRVEEIARGEDADGHSYLQIRPEGRERFPDEGDVLKEVRATLDAMSPWLLPRYFVRPGPEEFGYLGGTVFGGVSPVLQLRRTADGFDLVVLSDNVEMYHPSEALDILQKRITTKEPIVSDNGYR